MLTLQELSRRSWLAGAVTGDKSESTVHRIQRTYADKGIKVLLLPCRHMPFAATRLHAFTSSLLTCTCSDGIDKRMWLQRRNTQVAGRQQAQVV